jgi:hypothetical protein
MTPDVLDIIEITTIPIATDGVRLSPKPSLCGRSGRHQMKCSEADTRPTTRHSGVCDYILYAVFNRGPLASDFRRGRAESGLSKEKVPLNWDNRACRRSCNPDPKALFR